jgi:alkylated DNA repair protein (DNA oxidative demethylase)
MTPDLFGPEEPDPVLLPLVPGAALLRGFARAADTLLCAAVEQVSVRAPLRRMVTPGGLRMSVAMTNCGELGWVSDRRGYRYERLDPLTGHPWPAMPPVFADLARKAAAEAGFDGFVPDACLVNRYLPGTRLSLHQDRDERDFDAPIVSVSLGIPAVFLFGGLQRAGKRLRLPLAHGDVVVWGGPARLRFHGVMPLQAGRHTLTGEQRLNLTFRRAG